MPNQISIFVVCFPWLLASVVNNTVNKALHIEHFVLRLDTSVFAVCSHNSASEIQQSKLCALRHLVWCIEGIGQTQTNKITFLLLKRDD